MRAIARCALDAATSPVGSVLRFRKVGPAIALTFDDGPDPDVTPALLDVLADHDVSATFFMLAGRVSRYPDIARRVKAAGHEIALHGFDHRRLTSRGLDDVSASVARGKTEVESALNVQIRWFRPPYGAHDLRIWRLVRSLGMDTILWGPSLSDWAQIESDERWQRAAGRPGDIVLGHDGLANVSDGVMNEPLPPSLDRAAWAGEVLRRYREQGLTSVTVSEAFDRGRPIRGARWTR